jgi:hypothetical protein
MTKPQGSSMEVHGRLVVAKAPGGAVEASAGGWTLLAVGSAKEGALQVYDLSGLETTIGRQEGCEIRLRHATVSRKHARVVLEGGAHWVEDLGSSNGVRVNGAEIQRHRLATNDRVKIGKFELIYVRD